MKKYICIHGHFYQPPRENPWLEEIELQDSAYPYRDWNERITAECYAPNAASRILDAKSTIVEIVNNYTKISYNFGPTLLTWMERCQPEVYHAIIKADKLSQKKFSGHGAAIAQAYNHMIVPLANERDKRTQVIWGIKDFEFRFKRKPEGMWLPETAADVATLEVLAENEIKYTILAPHQARKVRKIGEENWQNVRETGFDPHHSFICYLPSGKEIVLFFYDGPVSHDVAFGGLLNKGEYLANRLISVFPEEHHVNRFVSVAADGETYGHHHRFGNMALSYCLNLLQTQKFARITNFGEFLAKNPPQYEVEIEDNSSWSCSHGVERWRADCGCNVGTSADWNQEWRDPLRKAMDWLRDELVKIYEKESAAFFSDPWETRNEYIQVVINRNKNNVESFLNSHTRQELTSKEKVKALKLLEMQRQAMFMYTSCGWFFDDVSGIETIQIIQYAARAIQLAKEVSGIDLGKEYVSKLEAAESNMPEFKNGAEIYKREVKPTVIGLLNVAAHYAISSLFEEYPKHASIYSYTVNSSDYKQYELGKQKLVIGKARICSIITHEEAEVEFSVLHFGDYNVNCGVRYHTGDKIFHEMREQIKKSFIQNDIPAVIKLMSEYFDDNNYSLWDLFKNEQSNVLNQIFENTQEAIENNFREIYDHYYPLMQVRPDIRIPLPKGLAMAVEFILIRDLVEVLEDDPLDFEKMEKLVNEVKRWSFTRDLENLSYVASKRIDSLMEKFSHNPEDISLLQIMCSLLRILKRLSLQLDLWKTQNIYFSMTKRELIQMQQKAATQDKHSEQWVQKFDNLGKYLKVKC